MITDDFFNYLRRKITIYTPLLTDNYKIINIIKIPVTDGIEFIITTDSSISALNSGYRNLAIGDMVTISQVKYKFALQSLQKDLNNTLDYRNATSIFAKDVLKFYFGSKIEISDVTTDLAYNGIHPIIQLGTNDYQILAADKFFKINIDPNKTITTNTITNEGYYNLVFWNSDSSYGSLNDSHKITEIIDEFNFKIKITQDITLNKYYFDNSYDAIDLTNAYIRANPRIQHFATEERADKVGLQGFESGQDNMWMTMFLEDRDHFNETGMSMVDNSIFGTEESRINTSYNLKIKIYTNSDSEEVSDINVKYKFDNVLYAIYGSLFNKVTSRENQYIDSDYNYYILPTGFSKINRINEVSAMQEFDFKVVAMLSSDIDNVEYLQVPLREFDFKYYSDEAVDLEQVEEVINDSLS